MSFPRNLPGFRPGTERKKYLFDDVKTSVPDPDPHPDLGSWMGRKSASRSGMNNPDFLG
jgi:hypothetical protein